MSLLGGMEVQVELGSHFGFILNIYDTPSAVSWLLGESTYCGFAPWSQMVEGKQPCAQTGRQAFSVRLCYGLARL